MGFSVIDKLGQQKQTIAPVNLSGSDVQGVLPASAVDIGGGTGWLTETGTRTYVARTFVAGANVTISNPAGIAGAPSFAFARTKLATSVTGTQNNYAPGLSGDTAEFWTGASDATFTGLAGGVAGQIYVFHNSGSHTAFFAHVNGGSSAGNKFSNAITSVSTPVGAGGAIAYCYDGALWQLIFHLHGAATVFVPTWTNGTIGNGTITGTYSIAGMHTFVTITVNWGTTTSSSGSWTFSLPVTAVQTAGFFTGLIMATHSGVGNFTGIPVDSSGTSVQPYVFANPLANQFSTTQPFTWGNLDVMQLDIEYLGS